MKLITGRYISGLFRIENTELNPLVHEKEHDPRDPQEIYLTICIR